LVSSTLKIVIPMAGYGARLRPISWSRPKQLIRMADKLVIDHLLDTYNTIPDREHAEFIFIVGYLGDKIEEYMRLAHPELNVTYVQQPEMRGQSHAISLAKEFLGGPMLMVYADTLIETDFSFLSGETAAAITWVKAVPDPRRFGVAEVSPDGWVTHLVEKPKEITNNLVVVGCYYFQRSEDLLQAIDEQMQRNISLKSEFFIADAVNIMIEHGLKMRTQRVDTWLDAGTPGDVLSTAAYLLDHGHSSVVDPSSYQNSVIESPVFIHPTASIKNSIIGPYATIGAGCKIDGSIIRESIIEDNSEVTGLVLDHSLVGRDAQLAGQAASLVVGDNTIMSL
jgi:glucose-1-phosphate thymidylyltransferase